MLSTIQLKNFQIHRDLSLQFRPGLNCIIGSSDQGKSAIVRAIRFLMLHETASGLTTHGQTDLAVTVTVDRHTITRFRNSREYGYQLDGQKFLACAREQPQTVAAVLNLTPDNIQNQFSSHFLLSLTPGQVAREINRIVSLSDIDRALGWLKERIRSTNILLEAADAELVGIQAYLDAHEHIPRMGDMLIELKDGATAQQLLGKDRIGLSRLVGEVSDLKASFSTLSVKATACETALSAGKGLQATKATKQGLESILYESKTIEALPTLEAAGTALEGLLAAGLRRLNAKNFAGMLQDSDAIIFDQKSKIISLVEAKDAKMKTQAVKSNLIRDLVNQYEELHDEVDQLKHTEQKLEQVLAERATCSKCGRKY